MKTKGFTLIELAVVLAIIAVLAAVLTPLVTGYLDQARIARAQADVRTIADSLKLHQRDTGRYPIYASSADYAIPTIAGGASKVLAGPGNVQTYSGTWAGISNAASSLENYVNGNFTGVSTTLAFPKAAFRGPYVASIDSDPWGNQYIVTAQHLGNSNHSFVISAGPNGVLDTGYAQAVGSAFVIGLDDIVSVIK